MQNKNDRLPERNDVPSENKWHIEDIFPNDNAFLSALSACKNEIEQLPAFRGHLGL